MSGFVVAQPIWLANASLHLKAMESCCTTGFLRPMGKVMWEWCTLLIFQRCLHQLKRLLHIVQFLLELQPRLLKNGCDSRDRHILFS